jgi:hypothetical protein
MIKGPVTLTVRTEQEAFDHTVRYLATKRGRAGRYIVQPDDNDEEGTFACSYQSPNGPCAIGAMIEDEADRLYLDGLGAGFGLLELIEMEALITTVNPGLLSGLQASHDYSDNWDALGAFHGWDDIDSIAVTFRLDTTVLTEMRTD